MEQGENNKMFSVHKQIQNPIVTGGDKRDY